MIDIASESAIDMASESAIDIASERVIDMPRNTHKVKALTAINHPSILRLRAANVDARWMITEYHANGTLANHREVLTSHMVLYVA